MSVYVVFKHFRQVEGDYTAFQIEKVFSQKEKAEEYLKGKPSSWFETRQIPLDSGGVTPIEFQGWFAVYETTLE